MSDYRLIIYADPSGPTGHFSVGVQGRDINIMAKGKYPARGEGGKAPFGNVPGQIKDDSARVRETGVVTATIPLGSKAQAEKVRQYLIRAMQDPGKYNILTDNCVDFAQGALDAAGENTKIVDQFDEMNLRAMGWLGSAGGYAIGKARGPQTALEPDPSLGGEIGGWPGEARPPRSDGSGDVPLSIGAPARKPFLVHPEPARKPAAPPRPRAAAPKARSFGALARETGNLGSGLVPEPRDTVQSPKPAATPSRPASFLDPGWDWDKRRLPPVQAPGRAPVPPGPAAPASRASSPSPTARAKSPGATPNVPVPSTPAPAGGPSPAALGWTMPDAGTLTGAAKTVAANPKDPWTWGAAGANLLDRAAGNGGLVGGALGAANSIANARNGFDVAKGAVQAATVLPGMIGSFAAGKGLFGLGLGIFHEGGEVTDRSPASPEPVVVQEGEFVLSPAGTEALGSDLAAGLNRLAADPDAARAVKSRLEAVLGSGGPLSDKGLHDLMEDRRYWDRADPDLAAHVAAEFKLAYPGDADGKPVAAEGGLIRDGDPRSRADDLGAALPEEAFVFSRDAVAAFGSGLLAWLNAHALAGDHARIGRVKRLVSDALGLETPMAEGELAALLRDPRYANADHPEHVAYFDAVRRAFEQSYPN